MFPKGQINSLTWKCGIIMEHDTVSIGKRQRFSTKIDYNKDLRWVMSFLMLNYAELLNA